MTLWTWEGLRSEINRDGALELAQTLAVAAALRRLPPTLNSVMTLAEQLDEAHETDLATELREHLPAIQDDFRERMEFAISAAQT